MKRFLIVLSVHAFSFLACAGEVEIGREIYHENCASCHGRDMQKPGLAFDLKVFPKAEFSRFQNSVANGKGSGMPAWRGKLNEDDIQLLWLYVKNGP